MHTQTDGQQRPGDDRVRAVGTGACRLLGVEPPPPTHHRDVAEVRYGRQREPSEAKSDAPDEPWAAVVVPDGDGDLTAFATSFRGDAAVNGR